MTGLIPIDKIEAAWKDIMLAKKLKEDIETLDAIARSAALELRSNFKVVLVESKERQSISNFMNNDGEANDKFIVVMDPERIGMMRDPYKPVPKPGEGFINLIVKLDMDPADSLVVVDALVKRKKEQLREAIARIKQQNIHFHDEPI